MLTVPFCGDPRYVAFGRERGDWSSLHGLERHITDFIIFLDDPKPRREE